MEKRKRILILWLSLVSLSVVFQILLGGYVRLTDSGLSMYDWHVVRGIVPPLSESEWQVTFENYKQTPEYKKINIGMSLEEYKLIYLREFNHRIIGRITGLIFVLPLFLFLFMGWLHWRESKIYLVTGLLYAGQGVLGWYMVKSGLVDHPHVSHFRLAAHLLLAMLILAIILWKLLDLVFEIRAVNRISFVRRSFRTLLIFTVLLLVQISYGAFIAGLDAGLVSDTFPLMFGYIIPPNLFIDEIPGLLNLFENTITVHFIHRWFAFVVFGFSVYSWIKLKRELKFAFLPVIFIAIQVLLGITVILFHVPVSVALIHQFGAVLILSATVFLLHKSLE